MATDGPSLAHTGPLLIAVGIDPDTKATGIAVLQSRGRELPDILYLATVRAKGRLCRDRHPEMAWRLRERMAGIRVEFNVDLVVIEWQKIYKNRPGIDKLNPNSILEVATVSGMALAAAGQDEVLLPLPGDWAPSIPKAARQAREVKRYGLDLTGPQFRGILSSHRTHVIDAISLAAWGLEQ